MFLLPTTADGCNDIIGWAFTTATPGEETVPVEVLEVTLYVPVGTPVNTPVVLVYVEPSMLNVNPVVDERTVMVPVANAQVGCVTLTVGALVFL